MNKAPTQDGFDKLMEWPDPERQKAGEKYEKIRHRLIKVFDCRGCGDSEDLADETINVVMSRIDWLIENYRGDPALYFYGVAKKVHLERLKKKPPPRLPPPRDTSEIELECSCLERCLEEKLTQAE